MNRKVFIIQSNYIPWKGYFDALALADTVILYDDAQYTRRDWRNRNRIKTPHGLRWLTIPVMVKGKYHQRIREVRVADPDWPRRHWDVLRTHYRRAPAFAEVKDFLEPLYRNTRARFLSDINYRFLTAINAFLGIRTPLRFSMEFSIHGGPNDRLIQLCHAVGANHYYTGPAARAYLDEARFRTEGIAVHYLDYSGYPTYPQLYGPFEHRVSVVDLLFHTGRRAPHFMKYAGKQEG